ncbi:MAG TPA: DUF3842 family protein [Desulfobacteraceae bacterium]|nr:DUF3842 family protein [Desulfobacteraceae bacterium]
MKIAVVDGQGGGIGSAIIKKLRKAFGEETEIYALGTNSIATSRMMKAGANRGATGEGAIIHTSSKIDLIMGSISILVAHSMLGELTPKMAEAISISPAKKLLIPLTQENVEVIGVSDQPLPHLIDEMIERIKIGEVKHRDV